MRILVVDDEVALAATLQAGLASEGYDVDVAHDGDTGLWMATEHDYALIILDVMLPRRNGFQVCAALREVGNHTPVLMLTAKNGEHDQAEGLDRGADDYLVKPFSVVVLLARIRALLRRGAVAVKTDDILTVGNLRLDPNTRRCRVDGQENELTHREFALLEVLATNPGIVRSKYYLLDQVWGPEFDGNSNVVEVYVGYLRRKLDKGRPDSCIQTVHGHGYVIAS